MAQIAHRGATATDRAYQPTQGGVGSSHILVLSAHEGSVDRRIVGECNALADSGRRVTLLSLPAELDRATLDKRVRVRMPPVTGATSGVVGLYKKLPRRVKRLRRDMEYLVRPGVLPRCTAPLVEIAADLDADAVHCHDAETLPAAVRIANGQLPIIYDSHELAPDLEPDPVFHAYWERLEREHLRKTAAVITVNLGVARAMADRYGIPEPDIVLNGCDTRGSIEVEPTIFEQRFGLSAERRFRVIYCGSLRTDRNLLPLVRAAALVPEIDLLLLGDGPASDKIRALAPANAHVSDPVPQHELIGTLRHADVGVIPYTPERCLNHKLCTPNKLYEYLEAGLAVVSHRLPEVERIVDVHGRGFSADLDSPQKIARALREASELYTISSLDAPASLDPIRWPAQAKRLIDVYERLGL
ncbi:MAG: glycosyltransferase [Planctomycetota bacterium]